METDELTNSVAPEPEGSSPYSQEPATSPYPEPTGSDLYSPSQSPSDPSIYALVFQVVSFLLAMETDRKYNMNNEDGKDDISIRKINRRK
jgi:hypothetical protein